jgi:hypothetical protein
MFLQLSSLQTMGITWANIVLELERRCRTLLTRTCPSSCEAQMFSTTRHRDCREPIWISPPHFWTLLALIQVTCLYSSTAAVSWTTGMTRTIAQGLATATSFILSSGAHLSPSCRRRVAMPTTAIRLCALLAKPQVICIQSGAPAILSCTTHW